MALLLEDTLHCPSSHHALTMVLAWASEEDGGSVRDEAGGKVPGDLSSQPLLGHLSHLGCDFLPGIACGSVATWGRCQSSWVNDACGRLALGPVADEDMQGGGSRMDGPLTAVGFGEQSLDSCEGGEGLRPQGPTGWAVGTVLDYTCCVGSSPGSLPGVVVGTLGRPSPFEFTDEGLKTLWSPRSPSGHWRVPGARPGVGACRYLLMEGQPPLIEREPRADTRGCQELRKALRPGANLEAKLPADVISTNPAVAWKWPTAPSLRMALGLPPGMLLGVKALALLLRDPALTHFSRETPTKLVICLGDGEASGSFPRPTDVPPDSGECPWAQALLPLLA
ncbi:unnamed protein product [Rangifer tarandus platyrhynchus]|uniref:Uncharacterized protein n=1 Tax=Rangifer tarandus platyrhynchus TaxID=3082113 RepID=A0AC59YWF7_RANTA